MLVVDQNKRFKAKLNFYVRDIERMDFFPKATAYYDKNDAENVSKVIREGDFVKILGVNQDFRGCTVEYQNKYYELAQPLEHAFILDAETELGLHESKVSHINDKIKSLNREKDNLYHKISKLKKDLS